jgi:hypothetical protein
MGEPERPAVQSAVAEINVFVSRADLEEEGYRASVVAGPSIGPEEARLERREFTGSSLMDAVDPALAWAGRMLRSDDY